MVNYLYDIFQAKTIDDRAGKYDVIRPKLGNI